MPYRIDLRAAGDAALDRLIELGALDLEPSPDGGLAALMPDSVSPAQVAQVLGRHDLAIGPAIGRDADSVWVLTPRPTRIGRLHIVPADADAGPLALRLKDTPAFGTGLHPTTALCVEALEDAVAGVVPPALLDVGTGSGVLALAALQLGVPRAVAIDIDDGAVRAAQENARLNGLEGRVEFRCGGPETIAGAWPLVVANVLASPLIEMAPALVRRVGHYGRLVLSGIPQSVGEDVERAYRGRGMRRIDAKSRGGWVALVLQATW